jgi:hypothetical protein
LLGLQLLLGNSAFIPPQQGGGNSIQVQNDYSPTECKDLAKQVTDSWKQAGQCNTDSECLLVPASEMLGEVEGCYQTASTNQDWSAMEELEQEWETSGCSQFLVDCSYKVTTACENHQCVIRPPSEVPKDWVSSDDSSFLHFFHPADLKGGGFEQSCVEFANSNRRISYSSDTMTFLYKLDRSSERTLIDYKHQAETLGKTLSANNNEDETLLPPMFSKHKERLIPVIIGGHPHTLIDVEIPYINYNSINFPIIDQHFYFLDIDLSDSPAFHPTGPFKKSYEPISKVQLEFRCNEDCEKQVLQILSTLSINQRIGSYRFNIPSRPSPK